MTALLAAAATTQQLLPPDHPLLGAAAWTKYHLAVTVQKDNEALSVASRLDGYHPETPAVSLDSFIDGKRCMRQTVAMCKRPSGLTTVRLEPAQQHESSCWCGLL
jgi:Copper amine oxidase, enzyme domain